MAASRATTSPHLLPHPARCLHPRQSQHPPLVTCVNGCYRLVGATGRRLPARSFTREGPAPVSQAALARRSRRADWAACASPVSSCRRWRWPSPAARARPARDGELPRLGHGAGGDPVPAPPRRLGLAELPSRPGPHRVRRRRPAGRAAVDRLDPPARRGRLRPAARRRRARHRGHRGRLDLRAGPGDRPGALAGTRRHAGAAGQPAVRRHRPARHHRHSGVRSGHQAGVRGGRDHRLPPRAGGRVGGLGPGGRAGATFPPPTASPVSTSSGPR